MVWCLIDWAQGQFCLLLTVDEVRESATYYRQNRLQSIHAQTTFTAAHSRNTRRALSEKITEKDILMFTRNSVLILFK
jgi:hypothetical protein